jgi:glucose-1-phosphate thymidylyltransferase
MKALILAAGYATRLYPITKHFPKPLLKVGKRAIIDYIVDKIDKIKDIDEIVVVTNERFVSKLHRWSKKLKCSKRIKIVNDLTKTVMDKRGAIGDVSFAIENEALYDDILVVGGDNLFDGQLEDFIRFAQSKNCLLIGVFDIKDRGMAKRYGVVKIDNENKIIDFKEKPDQPESSLVAMCLYYFPKEKLSLIKEYLTTQTNKKDATGFYIDWLSKKDAVYGFVFGGRWYDIGHHDLFNEAKKLYVQ